MNIWYGPQGGCYDYPRNANGDPHHTTSNTAPAPAIYRRCPWIIGGSQAPIDGGIYRKPAGEKPERVAVLLGRPLVPGRLRGRQQPGTRC